MFIFKLDGVGPVDNRPSNDKLHHFVKKCWKDNKKNYPSEKIWQSGGACCWRVCYQRGLPRLVYNTLHLTVLLCFIALHCPTMSWASLQYTAEEILMWVFLWNRNTFDVWCCQIVTVFIISDIYFLQFHKTNLCYPTSCP